MEPISLILAALMAGAAKGVGETAASAVKEAYSGLREALRKRWTTASAELSVDEYLEDPDSGSEVVEAQLARAGAAEDEKVLAAARSVLQLTDPAGAQAGKYTVTVTNSHGVQVGDHNTQSNQFGPTG